MTKSEPAQAVALIALAVSALCVVTLLVVAVLLETPRKTRRRAMDPGAPLKAIADCVGHQRIADYVAHETIQSRVDDALAAESERLARKRGVPSVPGGGPTS